jgi:hypothetical protein
MKIASPSMTISAVSAPRESAGRATAALIWAGPAITGG